MDAVMLSAGIVSSSLERDLPFAEGEDPKSIAKAAFKLARGDNCGFALVGDDQQMRAGVGALLLRWRENAPQLYERVDLELKMLQALGAAQRGIPVDFGALIPDGFEALGLLGLFHESKGG